jgi:hypothetical protein
MQIRSSIDLEWISTGGHLGVPIGTHSSSDIAFRPSTILEKFDLCGKREP